MHGVFDRGCCLGYHGFGLLLVLKRPCVCYGGHYKSGRRRYKGRINNYSGNKWRFCGSLVSGTLLLFAESNSSCMLTMVVSKTVSIHLQTYSHPTLCGGESYSPKAGAGSVTPPESGAERSKHAGMSAGVGESVMFKFRRIITFWGRR